MNDNESAIRPEGQPVPKPPDVVRAVPNLQEAIRPEGRPVANPRTAGASPESLSEAFLGRLRHLKYLHSQFTATRPDPPMWNVLKYGSVVLGMAVGYRVSQIIADTVAIQGLNIMVFLAIAGCSLFVPDLLLKLVRRWQMQDAYQALEECIIVTLRTFPQECEQCGGMRVLADRVEVEALVHVLDRPGPSGNPFEKKPEQ